MIFDITHSFLNIFADGRSDIKTIIFLLYFLLLLAIYLILRKKSFKTKNWLFFGITISLMYLYGLFIQLFYTIKNGIALNTPFITGGNGAISYSSIWHSQIAKASIGIFSPQLNTIDAGRAYLGFFPNWVFLLGSVLISALLFQSLFYFASSFKQILKNKNIRQVLFLIFAYATLTFSLIKTSIDGGLFHPAAIFGFIFIILFILRSKNKFSKNNYYTLAAIGIILVIINRYLNNLNYGAGWVIIQSATLILLYNFIFYCTEEKIKTTTTILFFALFISSWYLYAYRDIGVYKYANTILPSENAVYFYDKQKQEVSFLENSGGKNILEVSKQLNRNLNYLPITISNITCKENLPYKKISFVLISNNYLATNSLKKERYLYITNKESVKYKNKWKTEVIIYKNSCVPEMFSVVNGLLIKNNIKAYTYYNFYGF